MKNFRLNYFPARPSEERAARLYLAAQSSGGAIHS
jgi:hypothetical protein